ncbi:rubrerythrin family protein [Halobaculum sp. MBLA0147]|uniref:rubrerythrin family protein n=1 Tax=Halobaculum sp. MBLA0147 TaxID=3079934 RepID=UPI0035246BFF
MDAETFRADLEAAKRTELDRLGSNKLLIALTDATLETEAVLRAAADSEHAASETFREWAETESDADAAAAFEWTGDRELDHRERVLATLADAVGEDATGESVYDPNDGGTLHTYLRERTDTVERVAAGLVGRPLVSTRTHTQVVSFFVNEADETRADLFRELKTETEAELDRGLELLDDLCTDADDWERAQMVAEYVVQVAYDDYADALTGLGVDVKPVC